ncbi:MAG: hypothetical protein JWL97_2743, partial [Gemmatimonadales bacterium]|nr:hypothetical protein [Gemmatimonadales bacterium]
GDPAITLHQVLYQANVASLRLVDLGPPLLLQDLVSYYRRRNDEVRLGLVDVPQTELALGESRHMPNQLVGQRPAHSFEENRVIRVLEHAAVPLLLDVLEVLAGRAARGILLTHVAETAGELGEPLAIGALTQPIDAKMVGLDEGRAREKS